MASPPKSATLARAEPVGEAFRLLSFDVEAPLGFVGGQYLIVNTGAALASGKPAKRAYSILSSDEEQRCFSICVKRLPEGPGSSALHALEPGQRIEFSGPWGKLVDDAPLDGAEGAPALVVATDTGITAALGLACARGARPASLLWLAADDDARALAPLVEARLAGRGARLTTSPAPPPRHPERVPFASSVVAAQLRAAPPPRAFFVGDGEVIYPLRALAGRHGVDEARVKLEAFFHNPERKAPAA